MRNAGQDSAKQSLRPAPGRASETAAQRPRVLEPLSEAARARGGEKRRLLLVDCWAAV